MVTISTISDLFPSRYLKTTDVGDDDCVLTIKSVDIESVGSGEQAESKPVVSFEETSKVLVLNKTNGNTITHLYSPKISNWIGKRIALYTTEVAFQGNTMLGIRIRLRHPTQSSGQGPGDVSSSENLDFLG